MNFPNPATSSSGAPSSSVQTQAPALVARLILALEQSEAQHPLPPVRRGCGHLPVQYIPGSPMHWRYRTTAADAEESDPGSQ